MQVIGYIRVSTEEQDLTKQEHLLLKYAQQHARESHCNSCRSFVRQESELLKLWNSE